MNVILDVWIGFIKLLEYLDKQINGPHSNRFQDCFIKVKIVDFFLGAIWNLKKNWQPKSVFLAFTISTEGDEKIVRKDSQKIGRLSLLDFEFSERQKVLLEFRNQIGLVLQWNFRHYQLSIWKKWSCERSCRIFGPLIFYPKVIIQSLYIGFSCNDFLINFQCLEITQI